GDRERARPRRRAAAHPDARARPDGVGVPVRAGGQGRGDGRKVVRGPVTVSVAFEKAKSEGRAALMGYLPAGFPTVAGALDAVRVLAESGADLVEVGFPYSDPVIDGPVIQRASEIALANRVRPADVFATVEAVARTGVPAVVMTYWNLVDR